jgi:hypothetical protein
MAVFAAVVLIGSQLGPEAQGLFSRIKSEIEFVAALSLFGMPQAAFYFLSNRRITTAAVAKLSGLLALLAVLVSCVYSLVMHSANTLYVILFAVASAAVVVHGILRVVVLAFSTTRRFNLVTALPQVVILLLVLAVIMNGSIAPWMVVAVFLLAFCVGSVFAWAMVPTAVEPAAQASANSVSPNEFLAFGAATWFVATLSTATAMFWLRHIEVALGLAAVGVFSMGLTLVQLVLTPFNYAVPLLFKRWMVLSGSSHAIRSAFVAGLGAFCVIALGLAIQQLFPSPEAMSAYSGLTQLKWPFVFSAVAEVMMRIAAVAANAAGTPWAPVLSELVRIVVLGTAFACGTVGDLASVAFFWSAAAVAAAVTLLLVLLRAKGDCDDHFAH